MPVRKKAKAKGKKKTVKKTAKRATKRTAKKRAKRSTKKTAAKKRTAKKRSAKKTAKKKTTRRKTKATAKKKAKRKPNPAFMKPMQPDSDLAAVIGNKAVPRTEITKKLWSYIKKNNLQDTKNRRMINADDKLRPVFGNKKQVSMFEMTKLVSNHIREA